MKRSTSGGNRGASGGAKRPRGGGAGGGATYPMANSLEHSQVTLDQIKMVLSVNEDTVFDAFFCTHSARLPVYTGAAGFACGYRSLQVRTRPVHGRHGEQVLLSHMQHVGGVHTQRVWTRAFNDQPVHTYMPSVRDIQVLFEHVWRDGCVCAFTDCTVCTVGIALARHNIVSELLANVVGSARPTSPHCYNGQA
jgi:hypothetical protein